MPEALEQLTCAVPEPIHPVCLASLERFAEGLSSVHAPAYTCNMVDSTLLPLVECLLRAYADGVLLMPFGV